MPNDYRRYSVTRDEGELIMLSLAMAMDRIEKDMATDAYWQWYKERMKILKRKLETYDWRKNK